MLLLLEAVVWVDFFEEWVEDAFEDDEDSVDFDLASLRVYVPLELLTISFTDVEDVEKNGMFVESLAP